MQVKTTIRAGFSRLFALALLCCASLAWTPVAMAQHTSGLCSVQTGNVANGGSVVIDVSDCIDFFGPGVGPVQGPPASGTAVLSDLFTPPATYQAFVTYHHNGNSATSDTFTFKDEYGDDVQVNVTIAASTSSIVVAPASISLQAGVNFSTTLSATGGSAPYTFTLESGTVPAGMTLTGASLSGTPTQRTPFSFTVRATDSLGDFALKTYGGTIADPAIGATPASASVLQNQVSSLTFAGTGGNPTYSFAFHSGTLPPGTTVAASGLLSGTPTALGTYNFNLTVNDSTTDPACPGCDFFAVVPVSVTVIAAPNLTINDVTLVEGNAGTTNAVFTVTLSAAAGVSGVSFDIATGANTATANQDYTTTSLTGQTITSGNTTYTFNVPVIGDLLHETNETYFVNVTNVTGAIVGDGQGQGTITNDDALPSLAIAPVTVVEGNSGTSTAQLTVSLSAASGQTVTVGYATSDGTATAGSDYVSASGTLTFAPGITSQTVDVTINGDGTPEPDETFDVTLSAQTNASIATGTATGTITNDDTALSITTASLANATVGAAYSATVAATGGVTPYSFAITAGTLPAGLTIDSAGVISGTPTAGGSFPITVTVTDSTGVPAPLTDDATFTLTVNAAAITLPATTLADGEVGTAYSATINPATGGTAPYTYSVTVGALPTGLTLNSATGEISGTPTAPGTFNFSLTAVDSSTGTGPYTGTQGYSVTIGDVVPVANAVSATVAYNSGANPVTLNITGGAPTSVAIAAAPTNGTAIASGTSITYQPNAGYGGPDTFTYTATNSAGTSAPAVVTVTVSAPTLTVSPGALPDPQVGQAYSQTITAAGGTAPYTFALNAGAFPPGLTLAADGTLSGTPTVTGSFSFIVSATDSSTGTGPYSATSAVYTVQVAVPTLALAPAALAAGSIASPYSETVTASGGTAPYSYAVTAGSLPPGLTLGAGTGTISGTPTGSGTYNFTITATDSSGGAGAPFSVARAYAITIGAPTLTVTPAGGTLTLPYGAAYSQTFTTSGGTGPYSYSLFAGSLPPGVTLTSGGVLSGTPTTPGTYNVQVRATDSSTGSGPYMVTNGYSLSVPTPTITLAPPTLPDAAVGVAYGPESITASGGAGGYTYSVFSGALPVGMSFSSAGVLSGTPTVAGPYNFTIRATDANGQMGDLAYNFQVQLVTLAVAPPTLPGGTVGGAYSETVTASGGTAPYSFAITAGALPTGLSLNPSTGLIDGTLEANSTFNFTVTATDSLAQTGSRGYSVLVAPATVVLAPAALANGTVGTTYSGTISASGGTGPYSFAITAGALPTGMSFAPDGTLDGMPEVSGTFNFTVEATDVFAQTGSQAYTLVIDAPVITLTPATLPDGTAGVAYNAVIDATGGTPFYTFDVISGTLPDGLSLAPNGDLDGTPTTGGSFTFTVEATDAFAQTGTQTYTLTVAAVVITLTPATLPDAVVGTAYSQPIVASGGTGPYEFYRSGGSLPFGLTLDIDGTLSGTPTESGTFNFTVRAIDANSQLVDHPYTLIVDPATITLTPATLPDGNVDTPYSQVIGASGGTPAYSFFVTAGTLPDGLLLTANGDLDGTPTTAGSYTFTIEASDQFAQTGSQTYTVVVGAPVITLNPATLPDSVVGTAYSQTIDATGGTAPFNFTVSGGALPPGIDLAADGTLSGTATNSGSYGFTIDVVDGLGQTASRAYTLNVDPATITLTPATLADGTVGTAYNEAFGATGGTSPYNFYVIAGDLPDGLTMLLDGELSGTPTTAGSFTFTVMAEDGFLQIGSETYTLVVNAPAITLTPGTVPDAVVGTAYSQPITASGGSGPYTFAISGGALPAGITFAADGTLAGTPTAAGTFNFTIEATDAFAQTGDQAYTMIVDPATLVLAPATLADGVAGTVYNQTVTATGGTGPYTFAITSGSLPAGLSLSTGGGIDGTPAEVGSFTITVQATDSIGQTGTRTYTFAIAAPVLVLAPASLADGTVGAAYTASFSTTGGTAPYAYAVTAGTLPAGLSLSTGGSLTGTPTAEGSNNFTVTSTDALGFTDSQAYTLVIGEAAPVAVADNAATLAGEPVLIAVSANDTGTATSIAVAGAPANGTATVAGMDIEYTPADGFSGTDTFTYTATGPGGTSAPATVTVTVNPIPFAPNFSANTTPATPVQVTLTNGATGGPFTGADVVAVTPAGAGTTSIAASGSNFVLTFTPASGFTGAVTVRYTLDNAFATSGEGVVSILVDERPDPSQDAEVQGTIDAQSESTHRFATGQISNFQQRMEQLHGGGDTGGVQNGIGFAVDRPCIEPLVGRTVDPCAGQPTGVDGATGLAASGDARGARANNSNGPMGIWTGGMIRSGSDDGRDGNADISFETDGLSTGIDYRVNDALVIGGGFGYGRDDNAIGRNGTRVDGSARTVALYASYHPGEMFFLDSLVGYQQLDFDTRRYITANGGLVSGQRDGDQWFASFSVGADIVRDQLLLTPYARFDFEQATLDAYTEAGDPIYALRYESMDVDNSSGSLGLRMDHQNDVSWGRFTPQVRIEYQHDFGGRSEALVRYADLFGGTRYGLMSTDFDRNRFLLGLGALFDLDSGWGWRLEYVGQAGDGDGEDHGVNVQVQKQF